MGPDPNTPASAFTILHGLFDTQGSFSVPNLPLWTYLPSLWTRKQTFSARMLPLLSSAQTGSGLRPRPLNRDDSGGAGGLGCGERSEVHHDAFCGYHSGEGLSGSERPFQFCWLAPRRTIKLRLYAIASAQI